MFPAKLVIWLRRASNVASALAVVCPRFAVWCRASAKAIATLIRAYFRYARRRRSLRRRAAPEAWSTRVSPTKSHTRENVTQGQRQLFDVRWLVLLLLWVVVGCCGLLWVVVVVVVCFLLFVVLLLWLLLMLLLWLLGDG